MRRGWRRISPRRDSRRSSTSARPSASSVTWRATRRRAGAGSRSFWPGESARHSSTRAWSWPRSNRSWSGRWGANPSPLLLGRRFRLGDHPVDPGSKVTGFELGLEALAVAGPVEILASVDLLFADPDLVHRHPRHSHRGIEHLAHRPRDRRVAKLEQGAPVEGADEDRRLGEGLVHAFEEFGLDLVAVRAEQDQLRVGGAGLAEQVEAGGGPPIKPCAPEFPGRG